LFVSLYCDKIIKISNILRDMKTTESIISKQRLQDIFIEIKQYEQKLADIQKGKAQAAEVCGDVWHDNPAFEEIERLQKIYASHIAELKNELRKSKVLNEKDFAKSAQSKKISIGSKITIAYLSGETANIQITGSGESNPSKGLIAYDTPLGKALIGKTIGAEVVFFVNEQKIEVKVIARH